MSSNKQSNSPRELSMNAAAEQLSDAVRQADAQLKVGITHISEARQKLAAAQKKYDERMKGKPVRPVTP